MASEMLEARGLLFGSSTHDNDMLPLIASYMEFFKGLKPKNRVAATFGSFGWGGGALKEMETIIKEAGVELAMPQLSVRYAPEEKELEQCFNFGREFAAKL
jgi:flavorubredoxin